MAEPVEVMLAAPHKAIVLADATKLVVQQVALRITASLVAADGTTVSPAYTAEFDRTDDATLRAQALALAAAEYPTRFPT